MKNYQDKQDQSIAQQTPLYNQSNPEITKINIFISDSSKAVQHIQQKNNLSSQFQNTNNQAKLNSQSNKINQEQKLKRKMSQRSESYHRVTNSRRIKTKKANKQHLSRSEFFYFDNINEQGQDGAGIKLLNEYQAFQQMILTSNFKQFDKKIIKLSHFGNKRKSNSKQHSINKINGQKSKSSLYKPVLSLNQLSKSLMIPQRQIKQSIENSRKTNNKEQQRNQLFIQRKKIQTHKQTISKYTTPVRTIYLNKSQQSPNNFSCQSTSVHKLSSSTPLYSDRTFYQSKPIHSIIQRRQIENQQQPEKQNSYQCFQDKKPNIFVENMRKQDKTNNFQNKIGLSVMSNKNKQTKKDIKNLNPINLHTSGRIRSSKYDLQVQKPIRKTININSTYLCNQTLFHHSNIQSHSRSRSKKGLSLTQSSSQNLSKNKSQILFPISIFSKYSQANYQKQNQMMAKKLDPKVNFQTKKVELRIY